MSVGQQSKTWLEISASAVAGNIQNLRSVLTPGVEFCAVVKANAYGHGLKEMVKALARAEVTTFAVDNLDEAIIVRSLQPQALVFILGFTLPDRLLEVVKGRFVQTVYDSDTINVLLEGARQLGLTALINLKLETGLHRQGVDARELEAVLEMLARAGEFVRVVGVGSHFASSEDINHPEPSLRQMQVFESAVTHLTDRGITPQFAHLACSAAALTRPESQYNLVRFGLAVYGQWPSPSVRREVTLGRQRVDLTPVLTWRTTIAQVKNLAPGAQVGYGGKFVANRPMRIAVLPVGYYDGYDRKFRNRGEVLLRGHRCQILGTICMNMMMIDVSAVPSAKAGDQVTLLGRDGMNAISADDLADRADTINYEVVTRINPLLARILT